MRPIRAAIVLALAAMFASSAVQACQAIWQLSYSAGPGDVRITLNDIPVLTHSGDQTAGGAPVPHWIVNGKNVLKADLAAKPGADGRLTAEVVKVCRGGVVDSRGGNAGTVAEVALETSGTDSAAFEVTDAMATPIDRAEAAGADGLEPAVRRLQQAFKAGDIDTIVDLHRPMIELAETMMGMTGAAGQLHGMLSQALPQAKLGYEDTLAFTPAMDGKVYIASGADGAAPPVSMSVKADGGSLIFDTGVYWAKIDGEWLIVSR